MLRLIYQQQQASGFTGLSKCVKMFAHSPRQYAAVLALAICWLGSASCYGQGTIVYVRLSNPNPPSPIPPPWDDSGYPIFGNGGLVLDFNGDGQPDVGFYADGTSFNIGGFGSTRVLTYPSAGLDINSFLPVLTAGTQIGTAPPSGSLIWRETVSAGPSGQPYSATYNGANNVGYGGYWQGVEGYTGVEFYIGDEPHYAWIRVGAPFVGLYGGYIYDYAYEARANTPILAGAGVPEPSTWALLLLGAGLLTHRRYFGIQVNRINPARSSIRNGQSGQSVAGTPSRP
jgi:hypothetical protein